MTAPMICTILPLDCMFIYLSTGLLRNPELYAALRADET
jgi:hypothetical protein